MAVTLRGSADYVGASGNPSFTLPVSTNAGDTIVVAIYSGGAISGGAGCGATWTLVEPTTNLFLLVGADCSAGATSFTIDGAGLYDAYPALFVFSGLAASNTLGPSAGKISSSAGTFTVGPIATAPGDVVIGIYYSYNASGPAFANESVLGSVGAVNETYITMCYGLESGISDTFSVYLFGKNAPMGIAVLATPVAAVLPQSRYYSQAVRRSYTYFKDVVFDRTPRGLLVPKVA